ncbi:transcriptional regulator [Basfia succiniciproducens]|uniref:transcriptional regulator n=1 Tax=Basfia succiniciproducens TaxID=653940 RepID=UPI003FCE847A
MSGIKQAVKICGSQSSLARACGVTQGAVYKWLNGGEYSAKYAARIEKATDGKVTAQELCFELDEREENNEI